MMQLEGTLKNGAENIEFVDVVPLGNAPSSRIRRVVGSKAMRWVVGLAVTALLIFGSATYYRDVLQPKQDAFLVDAAIASLPSAERDYLNAWARVWTPEERIITLAELLLNHEGPEGAAVRQQGFKSLMRQALRIDSIEAHLLWGEALRDGRLVNKDARAALEHFRAAQKKLAEPLLAGDPDALWLQAKATINGLGVQVDSSAAAQLADRAAQSLRSWRAKELATALGFGRPPFDRKDESLAQDALNRAWSAGARSVSAQGNALCVLMGIPEAGSLEGMTAAAAIQHLSDQASRHEQSRVLCSESWLRRAAEAQLPYAASEYGHFLITQRGALGAGLSWMAKSGSEVTNSAQLVFAMALAATAEQGLTEAAEKLRGVLATHARDDATAGTNSLVSWPLWHRMGIATTLEPEQWHRLGAVLRRAIPEEHSGALSRKLEQEARVMPHLAPVLAGWRSGANFDANLTVNNAAAASKTPQRLSRVVERQREPSNEETHGAKLRRQPPVHVDPDQQDSTGYVPGAPRLALGGHSTFLIDNSQGGGDALVRLYRNGTKPAVRSLFVKQGERFTATDLRSGSYVMRYRYMGSTTTYEADQVFELKQVSELDGIRFSNIRVTLFAVRDGNMKTKQVAPDDF